MIFSILLGDDKALLDLIVVIVPSTILNGALSI